MLHLVRLFSTEGVAPMATKLKIITDHADIVPAPTVPEFDIAPTRKQHAGWTAERQRRFIEHLALTGHAGEACAIVGVASSSAYRLKHKVGAESFSRAWDAAVRLSATRIAAVMFDRALNGRVERHYKNGELVMERRIPSDYLLTWLLSRLDPAQFGSPTAKALAVSRISARKPRGFQLITALMPTHAASIASANRIMPTMASPISHSCDCRHNALSRLNGFSGGGGSRRMREARGSLFRPMSMGLLTDTG
jgi:hypothetical protein